MAELTKKGRWWYFRPADESLASELHGLGMPLPDGQQAVPLGSAHESVVPINRHSARTVANLPYVGNTLR